MELTVLVVDDRAVVRAQIRRALKVSGLPVDDCFEAATFREAKNQLHRHWCDAVLVDQQLDGDDGVRLLQELRDDEVLHTIFRIAISSDPRACRRTEATEHGAQHWIIKPATPEQLHEALIPLFIE